MKFLNEDYFLTNETAKKLFHQEVAKLPIIDFHTHLPEGEISEDKRFSDLWELWLKHDHYKWRLMRGCGVKEDYITGNASPEEKFKKFAEVLPLAIQNPVSHWAHLELQRVFDINLVINKDNAQEIWDETKKQLQNNPDLSVKNILKKFNVELVCTTDDPSADLLTHKKLAEGDCTTKVLPTFRPDNALKVHETQEFNTWLRLLGDSEEAVISNFTDLLDVLTKRHQFFHDHGGRLSDHGISFCPESQPDLKISEKVFLQAKEGKDISEKDFDIYHATILHHIAKLNKEKGWTMLLHLGPIRNNSTKYFAQIGRDSGFDSMGGWSQTNRLINFLDYAQLNDALPKTVVYNLNPNESESICCALQSFQVNAEKPGAMQYGPAWWHLDHKAGINKHLEILSSLGALGTFVGMLTDSRSFTSYVRHEYFRRLLCSFIGEGIEKGEVPYNDDTINIAKNIAYFNSKNFFGF